MSNRVFMEPSPQAGASAPAQTSLGTVAVVVLIGNPKRKGFVVQNTGTTVIKLSFGATLSQTAYHVALKGCTVADDGTGAVYVDDAYNGDLWAISDNSGGTCVVTEFTIANPNWDLSYDWGVMA
jgi:hypothetical protein